MTRTPVTPLRAFAMVGTGALAVFGVALATGAPAQAAATTRYVATTGTDADGCTSRANPCKTIQYAVDQANAGDTVSVAAGTYPEAVAVDKSLTITGAGRTATTVNGGGGSAAFTFDGTGGGTPVVTLQHISASDVPTPGEGSGVVVNQATVTIDDAALDYNIFAGLVEIAGSVTVTNSSLSHNSSGGAPPDDGYGALLLGGTASFADSTFAANEQIGVASLSQGGPSTVTLRDSTVSGNGVGVWSDGASTIDTSTVSGNQGIGVLDTGGTTSITNSTIAGTVPSPTGQDLGQPGGVVAAESVPALAQLRTSMARAAARVAPAAATPDLSPSASAVAVTISGSIVAQQSGVPDCSGPVTDGGYNLSSDTANSCKFSSAKHSLSKANAKLGALGNHGGPTQTQVPAKGSQAIDVIPVGSAGCVQGATDQRGVSRPQGPKCDIGAVEVAQSPLVIAPTSLPHATVGTAYHVAFSASGGLGAPYSFSLAPGSSLPPGLSLSPSGVLSGTPAKAGSFAFSISVDDPVTKAYTLVVAAAAGPNGGGTQPIANTGAPVAAMGAAGAGAVFVGFLLLVGAGLIGRRPARHRG